MNYKTEQEEFWAGEFGDEYISRNQGAQLLASNINFFTKSLSRASDIKSCIEFGANIGMNLKALQLMYPDAKFSAIEINKSACEALKAINLDSIFNQSLLEYEDSKTYDLTLIKGVLIHINPDELKAVYKKLYDSSNRYILVAEYYNPTPVAIPYRGHEDRLFKRDFAGEMMAMFDDLKLLDYGFAYHKDSVFPQDDISWFLLEKQ